MEVFENVKYIDVTSRASKLQASKVRELQDLNPRLPRESLNIANSTLVGGVGSNSQSSQTLETSNFEALEVTSMYFTFSESSSLWLFRHEMSRE